MCRTDFEGSQLHESPSQAELGFHNQIHGGHIQAHRAPHPQLCLVPQVSSTHLDKLEVIQNKTLRIATGCHLKVVASHLKTETGVLPMRAHPELCSQKFYAAPSNPCTPVITLSPPQLPRPPQG